MSRLSLAVAAVLAAGLLAQTVGAEDAPPPSAPEAPLPELGGFRLSKPQVPLAHLIAGGPPRDGIRSIDEPSFATPAEATWVGGSNPVLGVARGDEARAYPVHVIERHQIVNDAIAGIPVAVTYDPLTGTPRVFEREVEGRVLEFGVAGLLYNSGFLMYDRQTESLWSQFRGEALAGPLAGTRLPRSEVRQESMAAWFERHPATRVLARPQRGIDYRYSPFSSYWVSEEIPSRVDAKDATFHPKEVVVGVAASGKARAYLGSLVKAAGGTVRDVFEGHSVVIEYSSDDALFRWEAPAGVSVTEAYWFAWKAFHPDTEVWKPAE